MGVVVEPSVATEARLASRHVGGRVAVRVRLSGVDRIGSAVAVEASMKLAGPSAPEWNVYPTAAGTLLQVSDAPNALATITALAGRLESAGYVEGAIFAHEVRNEDVILQEAGTLRPPFAVLSFTIDPPYEVGPFNAHGVVDFRWGVPDQLTSELAHEWAAWAVPVDGSAVVPLPAIDVDRDDAADVLNSCLGQLSHMPTVGLLGRPTGSSVMRRVRARKFGEVMIGETGNGHERIPQAQELLRRHVLPHAANLDYATVRVAAPTAQTWAASGDPGHLWYRRVRHLWSQYVADPNGTQVLTDAHLDKARDLSVNWTVTPIVPGRWLVQANDLIPWFDAIDEKAALWQKPYVEADVLAQARHDFGDMLLTPDIAAASEARSS